MENTSIHNKDRHLEWIARVPDNFDEIKSKINRLLDHIKNISSLSKTLPEVRQLGSLQSELEAICKEEELKTTLDYFTLSTDKIEKISNLLKKVTAIQKTLDWKSVQLKNDELFQKMQKEDLERVKKEIDGTLKYEREVVEEFNKALREIQKEIKRLMERWEFLTIQINRVKIEISLLKEKKATIEQEIVVLEERRAEIQTKIEKAPESFAHKTVERLQTKFGVQISQPDLTASLKQCLQRSQQSDGRIDKDKLDSELEQVFVQVKDQAKEQIAAKAKKEGKESGKTEEEIEQQIKEKIAELEKELDGLREELTNTLIEMGDEIAEVDQQIKTDKKTVEEIEAEIAEKTAELTSLVEEQKKLDEKIDQAREVNEKIDEHTQEIRALEAGLEVPGISLEESSRIQGEMVTREEEIDGLKKKAETLKGEIPLEDSLRESNSSQQLEVAVVTKEMVGSAPKQDELSTETEDLKAIDEKIAQFEQEIKIREARLEIPDLTLEESSKIQSDITTMEEEIAKLKIKVGETKPSEELSVVSNSQLANEVTTDEDEGSNRPKA